MKNKNISSDRNLNYWQLGSILGSALGLPAMVIGGHLSKEYGAGTAFTSVCIGNFILWIIGLSIISMAQGQNHAVENVRTYLGKYTGIFAALVWVSSFLIWYSIQVKGSSDAISSLFQGQNDWRIGAILGLLVALISIGSIRIIKWVTVAALPLLVCLATYLFAISRTDVIFQGTWGFSFSAILSVILIWLPFSVNLPTIMRYSRSRADSILGLSLKAMFLIFFQTFTILTNINNPVDVAFEYYGHNIMINQLLMVLFIVLSYVCVNLLNVYFASAGWDAIIPHHRGFLKYFSIGLLGTLGYIFLHSFYHIHLFSYSLEFIETMLTSFIVNLGIILLLDFLVKLVVRHRLRPLEKLVSTMCWAIGCIVTIIVQIQSPTRSTSKMLLAGIVASVVSFLIVIFIEETQWSFRKLTRER